MNNLLIAACIINAGLPFSLSAIYETGYLIPYKYKRLKAVFFGLAAGFVCLVILSVPVIPLPGVALDAGPVLISAAALTLGIIPAAITAAAAVGFRLVSGGNGAIPGIAAVISGALIGLAWRHIILPRFKRLRPLLIYIMGIAVSAVMLAGMLLPPNGSMTDTGKIAVPVMAIYPAVSLLLCLLLLRQQEDRYHREQLKNSEEGFRLLFNNAPLEYMSLDENGCIRDANRQFLGMSGYNRGEITGKRFEDILAPSCSEAFSRQFQAFAIQEQIHAEYEMLRKDGKLLYIAFEGQTESAPEGEFRRLHCILQDITDRRLAEKRAQESDEKCRRLFETMSQGVVYQEADGEIISANPAAERILGLTFDKMKGRSLMDPAWYLIRENGTMMPGSEHPAEIVFRTGKKVGPVVMGIYHQRIHDHVWISLNAWPLYKSGEKNPYRVYITFDDITPDHKVNQNYKLLFDKMTDAFALHEIIYNSLGNPSDYRYLTVNPAFEKMTGMKEADILGKTVIELFSGTEPFWTEKYSRVALTGEPAVFNQYAAGLGRHFAVSAFQPAPNRFACTFSDITERVLAEAEIKKSEAKYSGYIASAPYGIMVIGNDGRIHEANDAAGRIFGYGKDELIEMNLMDFADEKTLSEITENIKTAYEPGSAGVSVRYKHRNKSVRIASADAVKLSDSRILCFITDITDRKKSEEDLIYLIYHDGLTGLYNRKYFDEAKIRLDKEEYLPLSVLIADINGVRLINDSFGYEEGDRLISETAKILKSCCREGDVLARIGGDEFTVLLPNTDSTAAYALINKITGICEHYNANNENGLYEINLSLGFSTKENPGDNLGDTTKTADIYLRNKKLLNLKSSRNDLISSMMATVFEKSQETEEHAKRMAGMCKKIGEKLNLSQKSLGELDLVTMLHDIGKIVIDDSVLKKPGNLSEHEWVIMRTHAEVGYRIAKSTSELEFIAEYILTHHERWDGKGYPYGLAGDAIPLLSRIIAVADAYDAMTNDRIYRKAMTHQEAVSQIVLNSGTQFDPKVVDVFKSIIDDTEKNTKMPDER